ncbi:hypothetical protein OSB04_017127 [Centaurea solstitialis]|uniref:F-box protein n=1 Tax=Centaurea solstitialis TaxID=347529 RepID=A0AA38WAF5_9ASTR|nr:hypothetical protein OSB04_017127 [Centaurea solstitialis]
MRDAVGDALTGWWSEGSKFNENTTCQGHHRPLLRLIFGTKEIQMGLPGELVSEILIRLPAKSVAQNRSGMGDIIQPKRDFSNYRNDVKEVEVYSMRNGSWKLLQNRLPAHITRITDEDVVCSDGHDGRLHWIGSVNRSKQTIVTFDLGVESFGEICLPNSVMNEYGMAESWTKIRIFSDFGDNIDPHGFTTSNKFLFSTLSDDPMRGLTYDRLNIYDPDADEVKSFETDARVGIWTKIVHYIDSLSFILAVYYWLDYGIWIGRQQMIVLFDLAVDSFGEIGLPDSVNDNSMVMNEYGVVESWVKLYVFSDSSGYLDPYGFTSNNKLLFRTILNDHIDFDDLGVGKFESFVIRDGGGPDEIKITRYVDSLVWVAPAKHDWGFLCFVSVEVAGEG